MSYFCLDLPLYVKSFRSLDIYGKMNNSLMLADHQIINIVCESVKEKPSASVPGQSYSYTQMCILIYLEEYQGFLDFFVMSLDSLYVFSLKFYFTVMFRGMPSFAGIQCLKDSFLPILYQFWLILTLHKSFSQVCKQARRLTYYSRLY